jgi:hypothetical protein
VPRVKYAAHFLFVVAEPAGRPMRHALCGKRSRPHITRRGPRWLPHPELATGGEGARCRADATAAGGQVPYTPEGIAAVLGAASDVRYRTKRVLVREQV